MSIKISNPTTSLILSSSVAALTFCAVSPATFAQTSHADHHHLMIGVDKAQTLNRGTYIGLSNPNYNRLSLLFPHQHDPIETSGFHGIGVYGYTGPVDNPTVSTSTNNQLPETSYGQLQLPLVSGTGVFAGKKISVKSDENMYSDLKTKPVAHLAEDLGDIYVDAIYHSGNNRWNSLLGNETKIALELVSLTEGLGVANSLGEDLFDAVGDTHILGTGDYWTFLPTFYVSKYAPLQTYSATFRLLDVTEDPNHIPFLESGTFTFNFQPEPQAVPEPTTILGTAIALGFGSLWKRKLAKKPKKV